MEYIYIQIIQTEKDRKDNTYTFIKLIDNQRVFHRTVKKSQVIEGNEYIKSEQIL